MTSGPVYVAGLERSGTSLMFALLTSHSRIAMTRRTNLWRYVYGNYGDLTDDDDLERCLATLARYKRLVKLDLDFDQIRAEFREGERTYASLFRLIGEHNARAAGKPRWGDKSLHTERYADEILRSYGGARIIHMVRDPRDRYASVETRWGLRRGGVGAGTAEWIASVSLAQRNRARHPSGYLILRYEDLVSDPEPVVADVCTFIGEEFEPEMLSMEGAATFREQGSNSSYGRRARGVISADSVGRFRNVLSPGQISFIQRAAAGPMAELGYEPVPAGGLRNSAAKLVTQPVEWLRFGAWQARYGRHGRSRAHGVPAYRLVDVEPAS